VVEHLYLSMGLACVVVNYEGGLGRGAKGILNNQGTRDRISVNSILDVYGDVKAKYSDVIDFERVGAHT